MESSTLLPSCDGGDDRIGVVLLVDWKGRGSLPAARLPAQQIPGLSSLADGQPASVVARTVNDRSQLKVGCHFLTMGVRPGQQGRNVATDCGGGADHHRQR